MVHLTSEIAVCCARTQQKRGGDTGAVTGCKTTSRAMSRRRSEERSKWGSLDRKVRGWV